MNFDEAVKEYKKLNKKFYDLEIPDNTVSDEEGLAFQAVYDDYTNKMEAIEEEMRKGGLAHWREFEAAIIHS